MSNFTKRILSSSIALPTTFILLYLGGPYFLAYTMIIMVLGAYELNNVLGDAGWGFKSIYFLIIPILLSLAAYRSPTELYLSFALLCLLGVVFELAKKSTTKVTFFNNWIFRAAYPGLLLSHIILIRELDLSGGHNLLESINLTEPGLFLLILILLCTFTNDTAAYVVGKLIGSNKIAPTISPGKTVEGTIGGVLASCGMAVLVNYCFGAVIEHVWVIIWGLFIGLMAFLGDLFESKLKRQAGVKDSGNIIPGHGGILDRIDGLLFTIPSSYYFLLIYFMYKGRGFKEFLEL